jgi:hypothetical protein
MVRSLLLIVALPSLCACGSVNGEQLFGTGSSKECQAGASMTCVVEPTGSGGESSNGGSDGAGGSLVGSGGDESTGGFGPTGSGGSGGDGSGGDGSGGDGRGGDGPGSGGSGSGASGSGDPGGGGSVSDASVPPHPSCDARSYAGTLSGPYHASAVLSSTFTARITFSVSEKGTIQGTLKGTSDTSSAATLTGSMDCAKRHASIDITMGSYGSFPLVKMYVGTMTADLDPATSSFKNGSWMITEPNNTTAGGSGTWSAP